MKVAYLLCLAFGLLAVSGAGSSPYVPVTASTNPVCPPAGYSALSPGMNLANLPSGDYAICRTAAEYPTSGVWTFSSGRFSLRDSRLWVDASTKIVVNYPAQVDWDNVHVAAASTISWDGLTITGKPVVTTLHPHLPYGRCGNMHNVRIAGVASNQKTVSFVNCSAGTALRSVQAFGGSQGFSFTDCQNIVASDLSSVDTATDGFSLQSSTNIAFIRPVARSFAQSGTNTGFALTAQKGSSATVCDDFFGKVNELNYEIGSASSSDSGSTVAVAGVTTSNFPDDLKWGSEGGRLYTLAHCPRVFNPTHPTSWEAAYTPVSAPNS